MFSAVLASLLSLAAFSGCGPRITPANIDTVNRQLEAAQKTGRSLSTKEVESVLGQPVRVEPFSIEKPAIKEFPGVRYFYEQEGKTVELHFVDNKLVRQVTHFGAAVEDTAPLRMNPKATPAPDSAAEKK